MKPSFYQWLAKHGCGQVPPLPGLRWRVGAEKQMQIMAGIRSQIIPARGVRVTTDSIPGFPERSIEPGIYDLDEGGQIDKLYAEMSGLLETLNRKMAEDKSSGHPLTALLRARQKVEILKIPIVQELVEDYLEKGISVAVFVNFKQTMDELRQRFKTECFIDGSSEGCLNRQLSIDEFQANRSKLILVNSEAGGISVSLHDMHGGHPRVGLVMPMFSAVTFRQVMGRLHREGARSPAQYIIIFAAKTVEEQIARVLRQKLVNLDSLLDGDLTV
jgi:SNF2 family DNA or RNA helicase